MYNIHVISGNCNYLHWCDTKFILVLPINDYNQKSDMTFTLNIIHYKRQTSVEREHLKVNNKLLLPI